MTPPRKPQSLDKTLDQLNPEYLLCRDFGHVWRHHDARWLTKEGCYEQALQCGRCTTLRYRQLSRSGAILSGHYDYPDGYQMPPGTGFLTTTDRDKIRIRSLLREMPAERKKRA